MSNFQCPHCGMINIDYGKDGFKTPKEIELEEKLNAQFAEMEEKVTEQENKNFELKERVKELERKIREQERVRIRILKALRYYKENYISCREQLKSRRIPKPVLPDPVMINERYKQALDEISKIVSGNYEKLDPLAKQEIQNIISKGEKQNDK